MSKTYPLNWNKSESIDGVKPSPIRKYVGFVEKAMKDLYSAVFALHEKLKPVLASPIEQSSWSTIPTDEAISGTQKELAEIEARMVMMTCVVQEMTKLIDV